MQILTKKSSHSRIPSLLEKALHVGRPLGIRFHSIGPAQLLAHVRRAAPRIVQDTLSFLRHEQTCPDWIEVNVIGERRVVIGVRSFYQNRIVTVAKQAAPGHVPDHVTERDGMPCCKAASNTRAGGGECIPHGRSGAQSILQPAHSGDPISHHCMLGMESVENGFRITVNHAE